MLAKLLRNLIALETEIQSILLISDDILNA
jgi:hypothetical protein